MKTLHIIGRGLSPIHHLTLQGLRALKSSEKIFGIEPDQASWNIIQEEFQFKDIIDISNLYQCGVKDQDNYNNFLSFITRTLEISDTVALLIAGNPRFGVSFVQMLTQNPIPGVKIQIIDGISSFDVMFNDLAIDPIEQGTSLIDVNRMLLFKYQLEPATNYFLYHVCSVGTNQVHFNDASTNNKIELLENHLLKFYSGDKKITLCQASNGSTDPGLYQTFELKTLSKKLNEISFSTTLFIPAELPKQFCHEFYKLIGGDVYDS